MNKKEQEILDECRDLATCFCDVILKFKESPNYNSNDFDYLMNLYIEYRSYVAYYIFQYKLQRRIPVSRFKNKLSSFIKNVDYDSKGN